MCDGLFKLAECSVRQVDIRLTDIANIDSRAVVRFATQVIHGFSPEERTIVWDKVILTAAARERRSDRQRETIRE